MAATCDKCDTEISEVDPGKSCNVCNKSFHLRCVSAGRLRSGTFACDACLLKDTPAQRENAFTPIGNSTMARPLDPRDVRIKELEELVKKLNATMEAQRVNHTTNISESATSGVSHAATLRQGQAMSHAATLHNSPQTHSGEQNHSCQRNLTIDRNNWRQRLPADILKRATPPAPLTKDQALRRKTMNVVLPLFDGNPLKWLPFVVSYLETACPVCGFTPGEDMERIRAALTGPALELVRLQMNNVENLDGVMATLQMAFGDTRLIIEAMSKKAASMKPLDAELKNIAKFAGTVDHLRSVHKLLDDPPTHSDLISTLESKLPLRYAEEWLIYKNQVTTGQSTSFTSPVSMYQPVDINHFADFLLYLHDRTVSLGRNVQKFVESDDDECIPTKATVKNVQQRKKTVLIMSEQAKSDDNDKRTFVQREQKATSSKAVPEIPAKCIFKCGHLKHVWSVCPVFKGMTVKSRWQQAKRYRRCYVCFGNHQQNKCKSIAVCDVNKCGRRHNPLLHPMEVTVESVNFARTGEKSTFFRIVPIRIRHGDQQRQVLALMDSGSSVTLIDASLAEELKCIGVRQSLALSWTDGEIQPALETRLVSFELENLRSGASFGVQGRTYHGLKLPMNKLSRQMLVEEGLHSLPIDCYEEETPLVLIGQDNASVMRTVSSISGVSESIVASATPLGYVVEGERCEAVCLVTNVGSDARMEKMLHDYIEREYFGLAEVTEKPLSDEDQRALKIMNETTVQREDGRYETGLLWKSDIVSIPNNFEMVEKRFENMERKLAQNPELRKKVLDLMQSHVDNGYVRRVESSLGQEVNYIPVFNVHNPAKPEKVRLVFDCAAQYEKKCLNSEMLTGPDLTTPLANVLQRFRVNPVAVSADIKDMYHRVYVREEDRKYLRFLWRDDPTGDVVEYQMCVLPFGIACAPSLAQYVKNINAERFRDIQLDAVLAITQEHYVDDWLGGGSTEEEVIDLAKSVVQIHAAAGFHMHKFMSNSPKVLASLGEKPDETDVLLGESSILGMKWCTSNDQLSFQFRPEKFPEGLLDGTVPPTKRQMLSVVMSVFDPLSLLSYITVQGRIILREAWRELAGWDDELGSGIRRRWREWAKQLTQLKEVRIDRWHGTVKASVELHIFVDASETAIAACCYVVQRVNERVVRSLVLAKCLVAPIKTKSIPRLELDAAVLGVRLLRMVLDVNTWDVCSINMWTDAKDVLWWLRSSTRRYSAYVASRVSNILSHTDVSQWRWTPTQLNPADWGTKGQDHRGEDDLWWHGPDFLSQLQCEWPDCLQEPQQLLEVRPLLMVKGEIENCTVRKFWCILPQVERFSSWSKYVAAAAIAIKFVRVLRGEVFRGSLTDDDRQMAKATIFTEAQKGFVKNKRHHKFLVAAAPFHDQFGVLRMRGRTAKAENLPLDARFPVIVPNDHEVTKLIIEEVHRQHGHQNTSTVLNEVRQLIASPWLRAAVKKAVANCRMCAIRRARPVVPQMSALPVSRMAMYLAPFSFMGIDYFGPINVVIGRRREKRWGVLMTCLTTRAVYLEVAFSLSTRSCVAVLDSLVARRGLPLEIYSDNATCFGGAAKEFVGPLGYKPTWKFIPPMCPSMGGAWERLVGVTKRALEGLWMPQVPKEEELRHALVLAERLINSRPLTEIPVDPEEEECLTPNHFLLGSSNGIKPKAERHNWDAMKALRSTNELVQHFWERFSKEYLTIQNRRTASGEATRPVEVGDIVFVADNDCRRGWFRAEVINVYPDDESNQVRQVLVRTANGKTFRRAARRLAPILRAPQADSKLKDRVLSADNGGDFCARLEEEEC